MKRKGSKKPRPRQAPAEKWIDVDDLVKPGEIKEIFPALLVVNTMVILDPPEPIKKPRSNKPKKKSA